MPADLPRPDVSVTSSETDGAHKVDLVVSRDGKAKSYAGAGPGRDAATRDVVEKLLADPHTAEWLPRKEKT